ncbi:MAG: ribokinase [Marivivens sp.]|nr:ribokinase [Marivivens sp.]
MAILNIGSINWDRVYHVDHFPQPGETLSATCVEIGLGGKGLNHTVAIYRSGGKVRHLGAIASGDNSIRQKIEAMGIATDDIVGTDERDTGSAIIVVDQSGENQIILDPGANHLISRDHIQRAIDALDPATDWLLMQNETNGLFEAIAHAKGRNIKVALAAAPFDPEIVLPLLGYIDLVAVNAIEFSQLYDALGGADALPQDLALFVSNGQRGARLKWQGEALVAPSLDVVPVDTTGAGDTAFGAFLAQMDLGASPNDALAFAMTAAGLQVTRRGAATAIPFEAEVMDVLKGRLS